MLFDVLCEQLVLADDPGDEGLVDPVLLFPEANLLGDREGLLGGSAFRARLLPTSPHDDSPTRNSGSGSVPAVSPLARSLADFELPVDLLMGSLFRVSGGTVTRSGSRTVWAMSRDDLRARPQSPQGY